MSLSSLLWAIALFTLRGAANDCPQASPAVPISGCWGEPGCAYVLAADLGPGAACKFDYCNCGGVAVPLLPTTAVGGSSTIGCGAYTTVPTAQSCPTAAATVPGSGGGSGGSSSPPLPAVVTTGGPVSTASDAFATTAPPTTTLLYQGGALTYTKETFSDLNTVTKPTTDHDNGHKNECKRCSSYIHWTYRRRPRRYLVGTSRHRT